LRRIALQVKLAVDFVGESDSLAIGALQIVLTKLRGVLDNWRQVGGGARRFKNAMHDSLAAMHATLQSLGNLLPFEVAFEQIGILSDRLKHVIQIVDQAFEG
jgi:hypothetical protein